MNQETLFDQPTLPRYPHIPGARDTDTSREAAEAMEQRAPILRDMALKILMVEPHTPDEIAGMLGASVLAIRPRFSELRDEGLIEDTGTRRPNASGRSAIVWRARKESDDGQERF